MEKDAANCPNVYLYAIFLFANHLRGQIERGPHSCGMKLVISGKDYCYTKVAKFNSILVSQENVQGFHISMNNVHLMEILHSFHDSNCESSNVAL